MSIRYRRKREFLPWYAHSWSVGGFADFSETAADADSGGLGVPSGGVLSADALDDADEIIPIPAAGVEPVAGTGPYGFFPEGTGVGTPPMMYQGTSLISGFSMEAAAEVDYYGMIPSDLDIRQPIGVRVVYTHGSATATDTVTWIVLRSIGYADDNTAMVIGATALDTTVAAQTLTGAVARELKRTARGVINANTFTQDDYFWAFNTELDATDVATTEGVYFLGLEVDYVPRVTPNVFSVDSGVPTNPLGD